MGDDSPKPAMSETAPTTSELDAAMARAASESARWMADLKSGVKPLPGPYCVIVDFTALCVVTREQLVDALIPVALVEKTVNA